MGVDSITQTGHFHIDHSIIVAAAEKESTSDRKGLPNQLVKSSKRDIVFITRLEEGKTSFTEL